MALVSALDPPSGTDLRDLDEATLRSDSAALAQPAGWFGTTDVRAMNRLVSTALRRRLLGVFIRTPREEPLPSSRSETLFKIYFGIVILVSLAAANWAVSNPTSIYQIFRFVTSSD
jgi:hypothetical protein